MQSFRSFLTAALALAVAGLITAGCAAPVGGPYAGPGDYGRANYTETGTIVSTREVLVRSDGRGGAIVGAVAGGATGAALGGDTGGSIAGGLLGALIGGILGSEIEKSAGTHEGIEYVIELDNGRTVTVIQDPSRYFEPGTRVRVIFGDYVRVVPIYGKEPYRGEPYGGEPYGDEPYGDDAPYEDGLPPGEWQEDDGPYR
jgi:outer membrane lipoprotein SlyB